MITKCSNLEYTSGRVAYGFRVERSKVKVRVLGLELTAIRRGFELYECLIV